jgi:uncharacterized glyoxalase superfamily protein PhnB
MVLRSMTPLLRTKDIKATIDFYTRLLGFSCESSSEEWGWASLSKDGIDLMVATPQDHMPFEQPMFTGSFYFNVENIEQLWKQLENQVKICYPLEAFEYGMNEFAIFDNNGYVLQFGEETPG